MYLYYERKMAITKKQLFLMSKQYKTMRNECKNSFYSNKNIVIKFLVPTSEKALTNNNVNILLAPIYNAPIVNSLKIKMEVSLLDCALLNDNTWFYVSLPLDTKDNCRGWINKNDISITYSSSQSLIKEY